MMVRWDGARARIGLFIFPMAASSAGVVGSAYGLAAKGRLEEKGGKGGAEERPTKKRRRAGEGERDDGPEKGRDGCGGSNLRLLWCARARDGRGVSVADRCARDGTRRHSGGGDGEMRSL